MIIGKKYKARDTIAIRNNGLSPEEIGYVIFVDGVAISLEFPRVNIELQVPRAMFGNNFEQCTLGMMANLGYQANRHASKVFHV